MRSSVITTNCSERAVCAHTRFSFEDAGLVMHSLDKEHFHVLLLLSTIVVSNSSIGDFPQYPSPQDF
jgi:hypothetical protein